MSGEIAARLAELGLTLPPAPAPVANYVPHLVAGELLFIAGQISRAADGTLLTGTLGAGVTLAEGQAAARACALNILAQANAALGSLDRIGQVLKLTGYVTATPDFLDLPQVVNGGIRPSRRGARRAGTAHAGRGRGRRSAGQRRRRGRRDPADRLSRTRADAGPGVPCGPSPTAACTRRGAGSSRTPPPRSPPRSRMATASSATCAPRRAASPSYSTMPPSTA